MVYSNRMNDPINDILETVQFIKEHASSKEDLNFLKEEILDGVDKKIENLKGDLVILMRKEDVKLRELVSLLHTKKILTDTEAGHLLSMEPFPQPS